MSLGVQDPAIEVESGVGREYKIEVLEGFGKEKALLNVVGRTGHVVHVLDASVAPLCTTVSLQGLSSINALIFIINNSFNK